MFKLNIVNETKLIKSEKEEFELLRRRRKNYQRTHQRRI